MLNALISPYLKRIADLAFKMVKIWLWIFTVFLIYALYSTVMWYKQVQQNADLEVALVQNKAKIDSIKIYQNIWQRENEVLRIKINNLNSKVDSLDKNLSNDLQNDKKPIRNADNSDSTAIKLFTKRYGAGAVRQPSSQVRADSTKRTQKSKRR